MSDDVNETAAKFVADVEADVAHKPAAARTPAEIAILRAKWQGRADNFNLTDAERAEARAKLAELEP